MTGNYPAETPAELRLTVNGQPHNFTVDTRTSLLSLLREQLDLTGAKPACERGECGACTVLLDGRPVNACHMLALQAGDREIVTVEGLAGRAEFEALVEAFVTVDGGQCGYCTPGFAVAAYALLRDNTLLQRKHALLPRKHAALDAAPDSAQIRWALVGHICRCNAYDRIVQAVQSAAAGLANS